MLVLYCRYAEYDDGVLLNHGSHIVDAIRRVDDVTVTLNAGTAGQARTCTARVGDVMVVGGVRVHLVKVGPAGCRLGFEAPRDLRIERRRLARRLRREGRRNDPA